jgi:hypothetical protein
LNNSDRQTARGKDKKTRRGPGRENDTMREKTRGREIGRDRDRESEI